MKELRLLQHNTQYDHTNAYCSSNMAVELYMKFDILHQILARTFHNMITLTKVKLQTIMFNLFAISRQQCVCVTALAWSSWMCWSQKRRYNNTAFCFLDCFLLKWQELEIKQWREKNISNTESSTYLAVLERGLPFEWEHCPSCWREFLPYAHYHRHLVGSTTKCIKQHVHQSAVYLQTTDNSTSSFSLITED